VRRGSSWRASETDAAEDHFSARATAGRDRRARLADLATGKPGMAFSASIEGDGPEFRARLRHGP